jgi:hypothetical protein
VTNCNSSSAGLERDAQGGQGLGFAGDVGDDPGHVQRIFAADAFARIRNLADFQHVAERIGSEADQSIDTGRVRQGRDNRVAKQKEDSEEGDGGPESGLPATRARPKR